MRLDEISPVITIINRKLSEATNFCIMVCNHLKLLLCLSVPPFIPVLSLPLPLPFPFLSLPIFQKVPVAHHRMLPCYGPLVKDGYSVAYVPQDDQILLGISSFRHGQHPDTGTKQYIQKLRESMTEMHDIMVATGRLTSNV